MPAICGSWAKSCMGDCMPDDICVRRVFCRREGMWKKKLDRVHIGHDPLEVISVRKGVVLPVRLRRMHTRTGKVLLDGVFEGGVARSNYTFVAGSLRNSKQRETNYSCCGAYRPKGKPAYRDETVVFGGVLYGHYGHTLLEGLSRMWWYAQNQDTTLKLVFVGMPGEDLSVAKELLGLAGLEQSRYEIIDEPTRFGEILVPQEALHSLEGWASESWFDFFDLLRQRCEERSEVQTYSSVYFTRTHLPAQDGVGEEYFEDYYRSQGYEVIAPEQYSLQDQIKLYASAKRVACTLGTLSHAMLFARPGTELTCLSRCATTVMPQLIINEAKHFDWYIFDAFRNVLPTEQAGHGAYLYAPTQYFYEYLSARGLPAMTSAEEDEERFEALLPSYLRLWLEVYSQSDNFNTLRGKTLFDVLNSLSIALDGKELQRKYSSHDRGIRVIIRDCAVVAYKSIKRIN